MKPIIVIGDSHVRAFAFNENFIPLFIGPAAFNNFLTKKNADKVASKVIALIEQSLSIDSTYLFLFSGDVEHVRRKSSEITAEIIVELEDSAIRYVEVLKSIAIRLNDKICVGLSLPGTNDLYNDIRMLYTNKFLSKLKGDSRIQVFDFNPDLIDQDGFLINYYKADFAHISYRCVGPILDKLVKGGLMKADQYNRRCDFEWWASFNIGTEEGPFKIWGDTSRDALIVDDNEKLVLKHFHRRTAIITENVLGIRDEYGQDIEQFGITVANFKQGQILIRFIKLFDKKSVNGFEIVARNRERAMVVASLFGLRLEGAIHQDLASLHRLNGVVVDFNWWMTKRENQDALISRLKDDVERLKVVIILSCDPRSDRLIFKKQLGLGQGGLKLDSVDGLTVLSFVNPRRNISKVIGSFNKKRDL